VKAIAATLGVSRSSLHGRLKGESKSRGPYAKADDAIILPLLMALVSARPTYGYRRITALLNRQMRRDGGVRDMMLEAVEYRFGASRTPTPIEMLTDNSSAHTARETRIFARQIGLKSCFTPVKSPQSNGISDAFVHTLKRDYVHVSPLPNARHALALLASWIEDYNENHPHSGLKMRSPREFSAAQFATP
jgi:hypothetical protein